SVYPRNLWIRSALLHTAAAYLRIGKTVTHSTTALILIVEDEPVIAMMLEAHLYDMGLRTVLARSNAEASQMIEREHVDAALLDFHVLDGTSEVLAAHLHALGIPFAMCTGSTATDLGKICPGVPVLQ